jgi:hypothetical protein
VILSRNLFTPYDERFRGYGMNKCIHIQSLVLQKSFRNLSVICDHFVVAVSHSRSEDHGLTYGLDSGYRKHVVAVMYDIAISELRAGKAPCVSAATLAHMTPGPAHVVHSILSTVPATVTIVADNASSLFCGVTVPSSLRNSKRHLTSTINEGLLRAKHALIKAPYTAVAEVDQIAGSV